MSQAAQSVTDTAHFLLYFKLSTVILPELLPYCWISRTLFRCMVSICSNGPHDHNLLALSSVENKIILLGLIIIFLNLANKHYLSVIPHLGKRYFL